jgi:hypothetical protein
MSSRECSRVYDPMTIDIMTRAFHMALGCLSEQLRWQPKVQHELARSILGFVDEREYDPLRLSTMAVATLSSPTGNGSRVDGTSTGGTVVRFQSNPWKPCRTEASWRVHGSRYC